MNTNTQETVLENIENLLEKSTDHKLNLLSEEKIPTNEEISFKNEQIIRENPKACHDLIKDLLKHSITTNSPKNEYLSNLKKLIFDILQHEDETNNEIYFDDYFFEKLENLTEKKEVFQFIEIVEIVIELVSNAKLLANIKNLKDNRRIFTMILNYLMVMNEELNFNTLGIRIKSSLRFLLEFLKQNS